MQASCNACENPVYADKGRYRAGVGWLCEQCGFGKCDYCEFSMDPSEGKRVCGKGWICLGCQRDWEVDTWLYPEAEASHPPSIACIDAFCVSRGADDA